MRHWQRRRWRYRRNVDSGPGRAVLPRYFKKGMSRVEAVLAHELSYFFPLLQGKSGHVSIRTSIGQVKADIVIPDLRLVIEYDGGYYHESSKQNAYDLKKTVALQDARYTVLRLRRETLPQLSRYMNFDVLTVEGYPLQGQPFVRIKLLISRILKWIDVNYGMDITQTSEYRDYMSSSDLIFFEQIVKELDGTEHYRKIEQAVKLCKETHLPLKDIAEETGLPEHLVAMWCDTPDRPKTALKQLVEEICRTTSWGEPEIMEWIADHPHYAETVTSNMIHDWCSKYDYPEHKIQRREPFKDKAKELWEETDLTKSEIGDILERLQLIGYPKFSKTKTFPRLLGRWIREGGWVRRRPGEWVALELQPGHLTRVFLTPEQLKAKKLYRMCHPDIRITRPGYSTGGISIEALGRAVGKSGTAVRKWIKKGLLGPEPDCEEALTPLELENREKLLKAWRLYQDRDPDILATRGPRTGEPSFQRIADKIEHYAEAVSGWYHSGLLDGPGPRI